MNYEQKYKQALERMKSWAKGEHPECFSEAQKTAEFIFPELSESEDENIRKEIIDFLRLPHPQFVGKRDHEKWIAWLEKQNPSWSEKDKNLLNRLIGVLDGTNEEDYHEGWEEKFLPWLKSLKERMQPQPKQGEQSTDKIEPKFKVGDWVVTNNGKVRRVVSVDNDGDGYTLDNGVYYNGSWCDTYHLWTIQDAKDGDVLVTEDYIFIFKYILHGGVHIYCHYNFNDEEFDSDIPDAVIGNIRDKGIHFRPATKEQRDLLFSKMRWAGFEWDSEKKELKKIIEGAMLADSHHANLWKDAQGNELPDYDREVVVLIEDYPDYEEHLRVAYGHRPNPNGYVTKDGEKLYPMTYDEGGWNGKNVRYWLDAELPNQD